MVHYVARIFEAVVPLLTRPTETFLNSLEEDLVKLIMKQGPMVSTGIYLDSRYMY